MKKVLFVCIHNSARSQMAEAFLTQMGGDKFSAQSAGLEPGKLNPFVVKVMDEEGIDLSKNATKSVKSLLDAGESFDYIIAVCDKEASDKCPVFPGKGVKLHWPFADPSTATGTDEEKLAFARNVKIEIKAKIATWIDSFK